MTQIDALENTRLMGQTPQITEPNYDWSRDWQRLAARSLDLVANNPFASAMVKCLIANTHGPDGLTPVSLAQLDIDEPVSLADHDVRKKIEKAQRIYAGKGYDVAGQMTRKEMDRQEQWLAIVCGESFSVRLWRPGRITTPYATCWRLVRPERVSNPAGKNNDETLYHGLKLNKDGQVEGIYIDTTPINNNLASYHERQHTYVPWYAPDGTPNVRHRIGWRVPGMLRGVSMFSPMLLLAKQLGGTIDAHVTAKRAQACNPIIYYVDDPVEAAAAAGYDSKSVVGPHTKFNPLQVYFAKLGSQVQFTDTKFNGQDLDAFLRIGFRVLCSTWQLPIEVVLCQMGEASLSSARAGLDQVDRTAQEHQGDQIEQGSQPADHALTSELILRGDITPGPSGIYGLSQNRYRRPPKYSTDRLKDANTVEKLITVGVSPTTAYSMFGLDYEDETDQKIRDEIYKNESMAAAGIQPTAEDEYRAAQAATAKITAGLSNFKIECEKIGKDYIQVWDQLSKEREQAKKKGLTLDLSGTNAPQPDSTIQSETEPEEKPTESPAKSASRYRLQRAEDGTMEITELAV